jgi:hypothetical protein
MPIEPGDLDADGLVQGCQFVRHGRPRLAQAVRGCPDQELGPVGRHFDSRFGEGASEAGESG